MKTKPSLPTPIFVFRVLAAIFAVLTIIQLGANNLIVGLIFLFLTIADLFAWVIYKLVSKGYTKYLQDCATVERENAAYQCALEADRISLIRRTVIVHTDSYKDKDSVMARGIVGAALFGTAGTIIGVGSGKQVKTTTFLIEYKTGKRETEEVVNGSAKYDTYIQFLDV